MKRLAFLHILIILFSLTACKAEEKDYKYSIPQDPPSEIYFAYDDQIITGGALVAFMSRNDYYGQEISESDKNYALACIFDEESKLLFPLCSNTTCLHKSYTDCTACSMIQNRCYINVVSDKIFTIHTIPSSREDRNSVTATYYTIDARVEKNVKFDLTSLRMPNESTTESYIVSDINVCRFEDKIYLDVSSYDSSASIDYDLNGGKSDKIYYHWILCYDLTKEEFYPISGFEVPHPYKTHISFVECTEDKLSFCYADSYYYVTDIKTGITEEIDFSNILSELTSTGKLAAGALPQVFFPIREVLRVDHYNQDATFSYSEYYNTKTLKELTLNDNERLEYDNSAWEKFSYIGEKYYLYITDYETKSYSLMNDSGKEEVTGSLKITENRHGTQGIYELGSGGGFECEKGFVYVLWEENQNEHETRIENGQEVTYILPSEMVYISKADIIDGGEVTPWYYEPESGMFVQK